MNTPNRLTLLRVALIPALVVLLYLPGQGCAIAAVCVYVLAAVTDYLDGRIARSRHLETDFGRFLDPVADKLLVLSTMVMLVHLGLLPAYVVIVVLARELSVDGLRMVAVGKGRVIAAGPLGKVKTASQMLLLLWLLCTRQAAFSHPIGLVLTVWILLITLWSGVDYFVRNRDVLKEA